MPTSLLCLPNDYMVVCRSAAETTVLAEGHFYAPGQVTGYFPDRSLEEATLEGCPSGISVTRSQ